MNFQKCGRWFYWNAPIVFGILEPVSFRQQVYILQKCFPNDIQNYGGYKLQSDYEKDWIPELSNVRKILAKDRIAMEDPLNC